MSTIVKALGISKRLTNQLLELREVKCGRNISPAWACQLLESLRPQARNEEKLDELIGYLTKHRAEIPNYDQRRANCQPVLADRPGSNGAGMVEKKNDLLVARRQKRRGMQWVLNGADVVGALRTLWSNGQWNAYWNTGLTGLCVST
jgi:hypothetical protein